MRTSQREKIIILGGNIFIFYMNKLRRLLLLFRNLITELFCSPIIINASVSIGYDGKPIHCNWGDDINYWFLREISNRPILMYNQTVVARIFNRKNILGIGSIIGMFSNTKSIVWGSGILDSTITNIPKPYEIRAVRGPLTRQMLLNNGIECPEIYGDPALLVSKYYQPKIEKKYKLGIISQYTQGQRKDANKAFGEFDDQLYIDIANYGDWHNFIDQILSCEAIVSSSLHGLIVSEAYGVPSVWIEMQTSIPTHRIKYFDFYESIGKKCMPMVISRSISRQEIMNQIAKWRPGKINLQPLIDCAPFKLKQFKYDK